MAEFLGAKAAYERAMKIDEQSTDRTIRMWQSTSTTWGACCKIWATWREPKPAYERAMKIDEQSTDRTTRRWQ